MMTDSVDNARVGTLPADEVVTLGPQTPWRVPWELLMRGPFTSCVFDDGHTLRHVTAGALVRSAVTRSADPYSQLEPVDFPELPRFSPDMPLLEAAGLVVSTGWELAVVAHPTPRLITPRSVFRGLLTCDLSQPVPPRATTTGESMRRNVQTVGTHAMPL